MSDCHELIGELNLPLGRHALAHEWARNTRDRATLSLVTTASGAYNERRITPMPPMGLLYKSSFIQLMYVL